MDAVTLSNQAIRELAGKAFVVVRVNTDQRAALTRRFGIRDLPALVFLSPSGLEVERMPNDYTNSVPKVLAKMKAGLAAAAKSTAEEKRLRQRVADAPMSGSAHRELGLFLKAGGAYPAARPLLLEAYEKLRRLGVDAGPDQMLIEVAWIDLKLRRFDEAIAVADKLPTEFPTSKLLARMAYYKGLAVFYGRKDVPGAVTIWKEVQRRHPGDPWAARAGRMIAKATRKR